MKKLLLSILISTVMLGQMGYARTIEVDVHGMTCAFCVDSLERKFNKMDSVFNIEISLKHNKIRLHTEADGPDVETIKRAILDAGFTPVKVTIISDEKTQG